MAKLNTPRLLITLEDGTEYDIQTTHADAVRFDVTRARMKWPTSQEAPMLWAAFLAWSRLKADGTDLGPVDAALDKIAGVTFLDADGNKLGDPATTDPDELPGADPTTPGPSSTSS